MSQTPSRPTYTTYQRPNPFQLLIHVGKTARLAGALMGDRRISIFRKIFFLGTILAMIVVLLAGDAASELVSNVLPLIGPALDIPADATLDWVVLAVASYNLLKVFPPQIVSEHYDRLFRTTPRTTVVPASQPRR
ncbi:MAG TPA: hypothetical protein VKB76_01195 [Ktedonobacterales bacterium]|nr:hypothetical protein [Ktedonobacterales bacterium]